MHLQTFYTNDDTAANDSTFAFSDSYLLEIALDHAMVSGDFDFAEQSTLTHGWTVQMATDYVCSKALGQLPLEKQTMLHQTLFDISYSYLSDVTRLRIVR